MTQAKKGGGGRVGQKVSAARRPFIRPAPLSPPTHVPSVVPRVPSVLAPFVWLRPESGGPRQKNAACHGGRAKVSARRGRRRRRARPGVGDGEGPLWRPGSVPIQRLAASSVAFSLFGDVLLRIRARLMFPGPAFPARRSGRCPIIPFPVFERVFTGAFLWFGATFQQFVGWESSVLPLRLKAAPPRSCWRSPAVLTRLLKGSRIDPFKVNWRPSVIRAVGVDEVTPLSPPPSSTSSF